MYNSSAVLKVLATSAVNMVLEHAHSVVKNYCSGEVHSLEYSFGEVFWEDQNQCAHPLQKPVKLFSCFARSNYFRTT